jgi:hypothetical protein
MGKKATVFMAFLESNFPPTMFPIILATPNITNIKLRVFPVILVMVSRYSAR